MTPNTSFRDVEKLSAYLDGQLKPDDEARLEARLQTDPELATVLRDLRQARGVLRQLPKRRAPRNFTLTPKMAGIKPPMPRSYPVFRFATVMAALLLFFTLATNFMAPRVQRVALPYGIGGKGGGGGPESDLAMEMQAAEAPAEEAMESAPAPAMEESAAPAEAPAAAEAAEPLSEGEPNAEDSAPAQPTAQPEASEKTVPDAGIPPEENLPGASVPTQPKQPFGLIAQGTLAVIAALSALIAFGVRVATLRKWRARNK